MSNELEKKNAYWFLLPDLVWESDISEGAFKLFVKLCGLSKKWGYAQIKISELCKQLRIRDRECRNRIQELKVKNLIKISLAGSKPAKFFINHEWYESLYKNNPERHVHASRDYSVLNKNNTERHNCAYQTGTTVPVDSLYENIIENKISPNEVRKEDKEIKNSTIFDNIVIWSGGNVKNKVLFKDSNAEQKLWYLRELKNERRHVADMAKNSNTEVIRVSLDSQVKNLDDKIRELLPLIKRSTNSSDNFSY